MCDRLAFSGIRLGAGLALAILAAGCKKPPPPPPPPPPTQEIVVLLDRSGSVTPTELADHERVLGDLVEGLGFGDRLVLLVAHANGVRNGVPPAVAEMPEAHNPQRPLTKEQTALTVGKQLAQQVVRTAFSTAEVPSTDLLASIHTAADQFRTDRQTDRTIVLMSDMLQCAAETCFEKPGTVPNGDWVSQKQGTGTIPDLAGVCVVAIGPDQSTSHGVEVRHFWESYFKAAGANFTPEQYRHSVPNAAAVRCA